MTLARLAFGRTFASLRRHRNYRLYFAGQLASVCGTWMQNVGAVLARDLAHALAARASGFSRSPASGRSRSSGSSPASSPTASTTVAS